MRSPGTNDSGTPGVSVGSTDVSEGCCAPEVVSCVSVGGCISGVGEEGS